jgi:two-component system cell cycle response regulator DivK
MGIRILCVEDNPQNMRLVRKILKHAGYEVLEAEDGLSGVAMASRACARPYLDGHQLARY